MGRLRMNRDSLPYLEKSNISFTEPKKYIDKWNKEVFNNEKPLWVEIGMGKGDFTLKQAETNPEINLLGIEKYPTVQEIPVKKAEAMKLNNLKFISGDANEILEWFNEESIDKMFINFPDPWPKERHAKRRLLFHTFLNDYFKLLKKGAWIEFKTDQLPLFEFALEQVKDNTKFIIKNEIRDLHKEQPDVIKTGYEIKFSSMGHPIYYVEFYKE